MNYIEVEKDRFLFRLYKSKRTAEVIKSLGENNYDITIPTNVFHDMQQYNVTSIGNHAFSKCSALSYITIPDSVTYIGDGAFKGCTGLKSITFPNKLVSIGFNAFERCTGLKSISIPNGVTGIGLNAFKGCSG